MKELFSSFPKNGHTAWFDPQTKKLEPHLSLFFVYVGFVDCNMGKRRNIVDIFSAIFGISWNHTVSLNNTIRKSCSVALQRMVTLHDKCASSRPGFQFTVLI